MPQKPLDLSSGFKNCPRCKTSKPLTEFFKTKSTIHGYSVYCKPCQVVRHQKWVEKKGVREKLAEGQRRRYAGAKERFKDYDRKRRYKLEPGEYAKILATQNGQCAICKTSEPVGKGKTLHIDHCHDTDKVRGLLCTRCNIGLGQFLHQQQLLHEAIRYLAESRGESG